jgi:hypothetical protein
MPLNDIKLQQDLERLYDHMMEQKGDPAAAKVDWATRMTTIISAFVRSGLVTTAGTAATQTGAIT